MLHTYGILAGLCGFHTQAPANSAGVYMPIAPMFHVKKDWGEKLDESTLKAYFKKAAENGVIPRHGVPDRVVFVDSIAEPASARSIKRNCGGISASRRQLPRSLYEFGRGHPDGTGL